MFKEKRLVVAVRRRRIAIVAISTLAVVLCLPWTGYVRGLTIDALDGPAVVLQTGAGGPLAAETFVSDPSILGHERDIQLVQLTPGGFAQLVVGSQSGSGLLDLGMSANTLGYAVLTWDGEDASSELDPVGLAAADLTDGGRQSAIALGVPFADLPVDVNLVVYSDPNNASEAQVRVPGAVAPDDAMKFAIAFTDFEPTAGDGADFANVGAIQLVISGSEASFDIQLDLIDPPLAPQAAVSAPEPSTVMLLALGGFLMLMLACRYWRNHRVTQA